MKKIIITLLITLPLLSCLKNKTIYTLYRNSPVDKNMRIHVATFDSKEVTYQGTNEEYNSHGCNLMASLLNSKSKMKGFSKFWCEKGKFKK